MLFTIWARIGQVTEAHVLSTGLICQGDLYRQVLRYMKAPV